MELAGGMGGGIGKGKTRKKNVRPISIPSTSVSETLRSTVFAASLTVSVGDFWR